MGDIAIIREQLNKYLNSKWGFVIYRCTYQDDAQWKRFMEHLNTRTRRGLEEEGAGDLFDRIDWSVQDNPQLRDASEEQIRRYCFFVFFRLSSLKLLYLHCQALFAVARMGGW